MRALMAAFGLFTIIPMPPVLDVNRKVAGRSMAAMPWMGLILGLAGGCVFWATARLSGSGLLAAALALGLLAAVTGALHLDGLADTADGLGSRKPAEEALTIMRRSDIGPMGVVTLLFALLTSVAALSSVGALAGAGAVACAAMVARAAIVVATVPQASARRQGFGALFTGVTSGGSAALNVCLVAAVAAGCGWVVGGLAGLLGFLCGAAAALGVGAAWAAHLRRRLGGLTGDTFGSIAEISQLVFLIAVALI